MIISRLLNNPIELVAFILAILLALAFHEYAHGRVAYALGDDTPRFQGRLTLNPLAHLDLVGTLLLFIAGFGWAKPVQVNPLRFRGDMKRGMMLVSVAGPAANILLAFLAGLFLSFGGGLFQFSSLFFQWSLYINAGLAIFNLIPVPPLDGSKILAGLLPRKYDRLIYQLETYGWVILLLLVFTDIINIILFPLRDGLISLISVITRNLASLIF